MKKEYMKPEAEEIMTTTPVSALLDITDIPEGETWY